MTTLRCSVIGCNYRRNLDPTDIAILENLIEKESSTVVDIVHIEEKMHHMNQFAAHQYEHGKFLVKLKGKDRLLEVTRDLNARPIFYPSGERI
ncbi:MAG: hypothetical protein WC069_01950 [Candidatus Shapirobacteria bacterium]